jgi:hypothetical protein
VPEGEVRRHANGAIGIAEVTVAVIDVEASMERYRKLLGDDAVSEGVVMLEGARIQLVRDAARRRDPGPLGMALHYAGEPISARR